MNNDASAFSWSRRQVMRTLVGTAGIPVLGSGSVPKRRVGIVGGGMAGISLAWLLDGELDVVAVGIAHEADIADHGVAVHRTEHETTIFFGHGGDAIDVVT